MSIQTNYPKTMMAGTIFSVLLFITTFTTNGSVHTFSVGADSNGRQRACVTLKQKVAQLVPGRTLSRRLVSDQVDSYQVTVGAGQFLQVVVNQQGIDIAMTVLDPVSNIAGRSVRPNLAGGPERIRIIAEASGCYRLDVRSLEKDSRGGKYEIRIESLRAPTPIDRKRIAADLAFEEGARLYEAGTLDTLRRALERFTAALALMQETGDRQQEAHALANIGLLHYRLEDRTRGLEFFSRALVLARAVGDLRQAAIAITNIGRAHHWSGERERALDCYQQALKMLRRTGDPQGDAAEVLSNIGLLYSSVAENERAIEYYLQSLEISGQTGDIRAQAATLNNLGGAYHSMRKFEKALDHYNRALSLRRAAADNRGLVTTLINIGGVYLWKGDYKRVLADLGSALQAAQTEGYTEGEAYARYGVGIAHALLNEPNKAIDHLRRGVELSRGLGDKTGESQGLYFLARTEQLCGKTAEALQNTETALDIVESQRRKIVSPEIRTSFFAPAREYYDFYVDLLMQLHRLRPVHGYDEKALHANERASARTLQEILGEADIRQGVDPALLDEERSLRHSIDVKSEQYRRMLGASRPTRQASQLKKEVEYLRVKYDRIQGQIRVGSPRYAALTLPNPLTLRDIQREVLDEDTLLLEYAMGEDRSYLWAVTRNSMMAFELPKRQVIEKAARSVYRAWSEAEKEPRANTPKGGALGPEPSYTKAAADLSRMILGPVATQLREKRLLIVGDGALSYVPFGALPAPIAQVMNSSSNEAEGGVGRSLLYSHEIVYQPSASTLAVLRRKVAGRPVPRRSVAIFADPVFDPNDDRVTRNTKRKRFSKNRQTRDPVSGDELGVLALRRSAREIGLARTGGFARLAFSRVEADSIYSLVRDSGALKALDFDSNKSAAIDPELKDYRIIHFATHSLINTEHPELSGVVMSLVDRWGRPQNGFLRLLDVYNLDLNADLVVLSACQTALGKEIKAEGLIGLARGFMYAGAARVMASLWKVNDEATAEFMKKFYEAMQLQGQRPAAALRTAQIWMQQQERWRSPYYWAGFVIQGEWR